jgi:hypothetical protein
MSRSGNVSVAVRIRPTGGVTSSSSCITLDRERGKVSVRNNDGGVQHFECDRVGRRHHPSAVLARNGAYCFDFIVPVVGSFVLYARV